MREISLKKTQIMMIGLIMMTGLTMAAEYMWTGNGGDNKWTTSQNWQGGVDFPNAVGTIATVTAANTIDLDVNGIIMLGKLKLSGSAPKTVTLNSAVGSVLSFSGIGAPYGGFLVEGHAKNRLVVGTDIEIAARADKMGIGAMEFTGSVTSRVASGYGLIFGNGDNLFSGTSSLAAPSSVVGIGNGGWVASVLLTNQATWRVNRLELGIASGPTTKGSLTQASDDCSLAVSGPMVLGQMNSAGNTNAFYTLLKGSLSVFDLMVGVNSPGSFEQGGGTLVVTNLNVKQGVYQQSGGNSEFTSNLVVGAAEKTPRVSLQGGTMRLNADMITDGTVSEQAFHFSGGTLQTPETSSCRIPLRVSGNPVFDVPTDGSLTIHEGISGHANIVKIGAANLGLGSSGAPAMLSGSLTVSNGVFNIGAKAELASYAGRTDPLAMTICSDGILRLVEITSIITVPLALNIESGGKIDFPYGGGFYNRGIVVAHTLATNGVSLPPGRYTTAHGFVTGISAACSVVVPRVWIGNGDGESWDDTANWAGGVVPNAATESADLSRAKGTVRLDSAVTLTCLIYNPQGLKRELTLTGSGSLTLSVPTIVTPGLYVGSGRTLTLDVPLSRIASSAAFAITGGGTIIVKKGFPGQALVAGKESIFSLNGNLIFAGETTMGNTFLGLWRHERNGEGTVVFTNGCHLTCARLLNNPKGFYALRRVYHDGGDVTCGDLYWTRHNEVETVPHSYYMRSGTLTTLNNNGICLGVFYSASWPLRFPSGAFVMSGGTVTTYRLAMGFSETLFDLHGGTLNLGAGGIILTTNEQGTVKLGGVRLKSSADWSSALALKLSGVNGSVVFDTAGRTVTLNGALSGAGGLIKAGTGTLNLNGTTNTFTGPLVVAGGSVVCGAASVFDGVSSMIVTNGTLALNGEFVSPGLSIRVAGTGSLILPAGYDLQVDRLWLDNSLQPVGTYTFGAGTVTVRMNTQIVWTGDAADGAKWSTLANWDNTTSVPDGADVTLDFGYSQFGTDDQIVLDVTPGVTLTNLVFDQGLPGHTLTITCPEAVTNALAFVSNGVVRVEEGQTLILDTDVLLKGPLRKYGTGTLILNRCVYGETETDHFWFLIMEGRVRGRGEMTRLRVQPASALPLATPPEFVLEGDSAVMRGRIIALPGYQNQKKDRGVFTQDGGVVDQSTLPAGFYSGTWGSILTYGAGTEGTYHLKSGTYATCPTRSSYLVGGGGMATFNQAGGTSTFHRLNLTWVASNADEQGTLNLSGGTLRFSETVLKGSNAGRVNFSGGRVEPLANGAVFAPDVPITFATGGSGNVTFAQASAAFVNTLPGTLSGSGGLIQAGPGTLALTGANMFGGSVAVSGGTLLVNTPLHNATDIYADGGHLELLAAAPALTNLSVRAAGATVRIVTDATPFGENLTLNLMEGIVTELDFAGIVEVDGLILGGRARTPGLYGWIDSEAAEKPSSVYFTGTGTLRVLNGPLPSGAVILIR